MCDLLYDHYKCPRIARGTTELSDIFYDNVGMVLSSSCEVRRLDNSSTCCGSNSECHRTTPATTSNKQPILSEVTSFYPSQGRIIVEFTTSSAQPQPLTCAALSSETSLATCSSSSWKNDAAGCITLRSPAICGSEA